MSVVLFACKSNSCRSQMAEGWAKEWIKTERHSIEQRRIQRYNGSVCSVVSKPPSQILREDKQKQTQLMIDSKTQNEDPVCDVKYESFVEKIDESIITPSDQCCNDEADNRRIRFLDTLVVASVSLDESAIFASAAPKNDESSSPVPKSKQVSCVTCDGDICASFPHLRKVVKEKAIRAMAEDGVDISAFRPKNIHDILPVLLDNVRLCKKVSNEDKVEPLGDSSSSRWKRFFSLMHDFLKQTSREMGMAYAGVVKVERGDDLDHRSNCAEEQVVDKLVVLCACSTGLKRQLSDMSKETLDWDIDAPTTASKAGEGDGAYLRVSRQIRRNVDGFMDRLKEAALEDIEN